MNCRFTRHFHRISVHRFVGAKRTSIVSASPVSPMAKKPVRCYVIDAFTDSAFKGNPAAVCLLEEERKSEWLQAVAREFNLSETCYLTRISDPNTGNPDSIDHNQNPSFHLRWFTPASEVNLCGHATLAAAHALFSSSLASFHKVEFSTLSGVLIAKRVPKTNNPNALNCPKDESQEHFVIELDFPSCPIVECNPEEVSSISKSLSGASMVDMKKATILDDLLVELPSEKDVVEFQPQFEEIRRCPGRGLIITAASNLGFDFYSRFFCPKHGVNEDPVCGSAHCALAMYWSKKLGKNDFVAYQASPRGGVVHLHVDDEGKRVFLQGKAVTVMEGSVLV